MVGTSENLSLSLSLCLSLSLSLSHTKIDLSDDITCNLFEIIQTIGLKLVNIRWFASFANEWVF